MASCGVLESFQISMVRITSVYVYANCNYIEHLYCLWEFTVIGQCFAPKLRLVAVQVNTTWMQINVFQYFIHL